MEDIGQVEELENTLLDESKPYIEKLDAVVAGWKLYYEHAVDKESPEVLNQVLPALFRAAVRIILHGDWPRLKHVTRRKFTSLIKRCNQYLCRKFPDSAKKCKTLTFLWVDPWDHPVLRQILEKATAPDEDVCSLMNHEGNELLFLRIEAMCEGKCEDLALQLSACYLKHLKQSSNCHDVDINDMNDIFIALLYKFNKKQEVTDMLKAMSVNEGIKLISRFNEKSKGRGRLWKHFEKMKYVACSTLLDITMDTCVESTQDQDSLSQLIDQWIKFNILPKMGSGEPMKPVSEVARQLISTAGSARHIYIFARVLNNQYGDQLKLLCIELYIRGLTLNINEIEESKVLGNEKLVKSNNDLADGLLQLAELFSGNDSVCRECILSSFCLNPTKETLRRIQTLIQVEGNIKSLESCSDTRRVEKCVYHSQYNCSCMNTMLSIQLDPDILKSAPHLPDDLATVLSRSRSKELSWSLGKNLDKECQKYQKNYKGPQSRTQELHYLNIDYSKFKDWSKTDEDDKLCNSLPLKSKVRKVSSNNVNKSLNVCQDDSSSVKVRRKSLQCSSISKNGQRRKFNNTIPPCGKVCCSINPSLQKNDNSTGIIEDNELDMNNQGIFCHDEKPSGSKRTKTSIGTSASFMRYRTDSGTQTESKYFAANCWDPSSGTVEAKPPPNEGNLSVIKNASAPQNSKQNSFLHLNQITSAGSANKCTTPISSFEFNKPVRKYFNRRTANTNIINNSRTCHSNSRTHSPKPAEVPPTASTDIRIQEKLTPILKSLDLNPKVVLEDIFAVNRTNTKLPANLPDKHNAPNHQDNLDILAQAVMRSDILLAKSVPGMSSVDMMVPEPQETMVHVVQITNSTPSIAQPTVTTVPSSSAGHSMHASNSPIVTNLIQSNNNPSSLSRFKPIEAAYLSNTSTPTQGHEVVKRDEGNSYAASSVSGNPAPSLVAPSHSDSGLNSIQILTSNPQISSKSPAKIHLAVTSEQQTTEEPSTSHQEGTIVTAHIQRVGQPLKQRNVSEIPTSQSNNSKLVQNNDEGSKVSSSQVFRLIVKDGRVVEQYYQGNQSLEPVLSIPDSEEAERQTGLSHSYYHDQFIKLLKKKNELKGKQTYKSSDESQVSSLPKFHHVFGRQIYQNDSLSLENSAMSSHSQYDERPNNSDMKSQTDTSSSTLGLSKAVQTVSKDDPPSKTVLKRRVEVQTHINTSTSVRLPSSNAAVSETKDVRHNSELPSSSGVIFTCKVPISLANSPVLQGKPVTILKTTQTSTDSASCSKPPDNDIRGKDSVIRSSNMNALLAAALQNSSPIKHTVINNPTNPSAPISSVKHIKVNNAEGIVMQKIRMPTPLQKNVRRPTQPSRYIRPVMQVSTGNSTTQTGPPVVTIPLPTRTVVLANVNESMVQANVPKVDARQEHINTEQSSVSSTTLEQLREFESVLEQVTNTSQMKERGNVKKVEHQPTQTTSSDFTAAASKMNPIFQSSLGSAMTDMNNERVSLTFINKNVSTASSSLVTSNSPKIAATTPVVVVQSCSRPLASPALSITSQSSLSPAPQTSPAHVQGKIGSKVNKPKVKSSIGKTTPATTIKVAALPKPQQKPQEDEQTTQRIYAILDKYAEQLRNSPELKNKPAPRRRSNPPTNPTQSSKRKKSSHSKSKSVPSLPTFSGSEMSPGSEDLRTLGSEDSSNGVSQLSQVINSPQSRNDEHSNPPGGDVSSETSESLDSKDQRSQHRILLTEPSSSSGRTVLVQENIQPLINVESSKVLAGKQLVVGSGATVPLTLSLPAGNVKQVIFPVPTDGRPFVVAKVPKMYRVHQVTMPSGSPLLTTTGSGAVVLRQMCLNKSAPGVKQVKLPVVSQLPSQGLNTISSQPAVVLPSGSQSFTLATAGSGLDSDSLGITLDNTILLNTSTSQSLGFFQRNVTKSIGSQQSPNLLIPCSRASQDSDSSVQYSGPSDVHANHTKNENALPNHLVTTVVDDLKSNSSQNAIDFKNEEPKFNKNSEVVPEKPTSRTPDAVTTGSKSWVCILEDVKGPEKAQEEVQSTKLEQKVMKTELPDTHQEEPQTKPGTTKNDDDVKSSNQNESVIKAKIKVETQLEEEKSVSEVTKSNPVNIQPNCSEQWQFNLTKIEKSDKELKPETVAPESVKKNQGVLINNLSNPVSVKRKVAGESSMFQVAFKRTDKLKLVKDDFIPQRNSSNTLEREIRLQKSLSEECEDLGVDKPRTSELFPEAELLLDSDPLSRDSLQELYSRGMESSSSSHDSPLRSSPTVIGENPHTKIPSLWKKQKHFVKLKPIENNPQKISKVEKIDTKPESVCESSNVNGSSKPSNIQVSSHMKPSEHPSFKQGSCEIKKDNSLPSGSRDEIASTDSDNCNFTEIDDSCMAPDLMDTDGESDLDMHGHVSKARVYEDLIDQIHENESCDKVDDFSTIQKCSTCAYKPDKQESFKSKVERDLKWFNIEQEGNKVTANPNMTEDPSKSNKIESSSDNSINGVLDDWNSNRDDQISDRNLRRSRSGSNSLCREIHSPKSKRKKNSSFVSSAGEDSGSSMDTLLNVGSNEVDIDRSSRRSSSRGRVKKGCPCFNGSPDLVKNNKDCSAESFAKTEKPCVSKPVNLYLSPSKKSPKLAIKSPLKKR